MRGMETERRATGRNASALKYDLLTALGAHACGGDKHLQRLTLRFMTLIVARYNWAGDELSIGQRDIAALWAVDERSVKREMAKLKALGWLQVKRPAARGRVAVYALPIAAILEQTRPAWPRIGCDYMARMAPGESAGDAAEAPATNVISFPAVVTEGGLWPRMQARLAQEDPDLHRAWFAALSVETEEGGLLILTAPTRFHASYVASNYALRLTRLASALQGGAVRVELLARN